MEEIVEPLEDEWPVSDEPADYEAQAAAETIPPWMQAAETDETTIEREPPERTPRPSFPEETAREEEERPPWPHDDEAARAAPEMQTTADADEAAASEKAARLSQAMAQQAPTVVETEAETDRGWMLPLLIVVAAVIFLLLVYAVFTYLL